MKKTKNDLEQEIQILKEQKETAERMWKEEATKLRIKIDHAWEQKEITFTGKMLTFVIISWLPTIIWAIVGGYYWFSNGLWFLILLGLMFHPIFVYMLYDKINEATKC